MTTNLSAATIGKAAARRNHGPWPALYDIGLGVAGRYVGGRLTRIDEGGEHLLEGTSPLILAANHQDHLDYDTILISTPKARRRRLRYVASEEVLNALGGGRGRMRRARGAVIRGIATHVHRVIPVRGDVRGSAAVAAMAAALAGGDTVVIFPEGAHNRGTEGVTDLKPGVAALARASGVPILPIRIDGTRGKLPARTAILVRTKPHITVRYRRPIEVGPSESDEQILARLATALAPPDGPGT
ncbi:MAG: lysophospholipid acyltransferase family protein [Candidatus Nanopelagicales bacterium]